MKKRHHIVPKCYLENFVDDDGFVWVLDTEDSIFNIKPANILVENHFYTITLKNGEKSLFVEDTLANIESKYIDIFNNKLSKDIFLDDTERANVSVFLAALFLRTKTHREGLKGMFQKLKSSMEEWKKHYETNKQSRDFASVMPSSGKTISIDDVNEYLKNYKDQHSINIIDQLPEISQIIFNMKWSIWKNKNNNFVTCDNPLYLIRPASIKKYGTNVIGSQPGLLYNDVELTVPLASGRLLLAGWILEQDSYFEVDDDLAEKMNHRTICSSSERIITNSKEKAEMIKNKYTETAYKQARKA
jgi:hypothetical protein